MDALQVLNEFLGKIQKSDQDKFDKSLLLQAFSDLGKVIDFGSMKEQELGELLNYIGGIRIQISLPERKLRDQFFNTVARASKALEKLKSTPFVWGGLHPDLCHDLANVESRLNEVYENKKTWRRGRSQERTLWQTKGIQRLFKILKRSQQEKNAVNRWGSFKIKEYGQFDKRKRFSGQVLFEPTPARLISNFAKGLGVLLSELAVVDDIMRNSRPSKSGKRKLVKRRK